MTEQEVKALGDKMGVNWHDVSLAEFQMGLAVETEHKDVTHGDPTVTARIALAHLKERPDYYSRLRQVEGGAIHEHKPKHGFFSRMIHLVDKEEEPEPDADEDYPEYPRSSREGSTKAMIRKLRREGRI